MPYATEAHQNMQLHYAPASDEGAEAIAGQRCMYRYMLSSFTSNIAQGPLLLKV